MARTKFRVNKSELIREVLRANPHLMPQEIVAVVNKQGIATVDAGLASNVKSKFVRELGSNGNGHTGGANGVHAAPIPDAPQDAAPAPVPTAPAGMPRFELDTPAMATLRSLVWMIGKEWTKRLIDSMEQGELLS
jgi:hypothetical protein